MIISISLIKGFNKVQNPFLIKSLSNLGLEENFLILIKGIYEKLKCNIMLNGERLNAFPFRLGTRQGSLLSPVLFNSILEVLSSAMRQQKEGKRIQIGKE